MPPPDETSVAFTGIPEAALDFYDDLEMDNTRTFWERRRDVYESAVRAPMRALGEALEEEFGAPRLFRPNRDVRFSKDTSPYKTHQGLYVAVAEATGYYAQVSAPGLMVGVGFYAASPERLAAIRAGIDGPDGAGLQRIVDAMLERGWELGGDTVRTRPRGWPADHERIGLLRHKTMTLRKDYGFDPVIHTPSLVDRVRADWRAGRPFLEWVVSHAG